MAPVPEGMLGGLCTGANRFDELSSRREVLLKVRLAQMSVLGNQSVCSQLDSSQLLSLGGKVAGQGNGLRASRRGGDKG